MKENKITHLSEHRQVKPVVTNGGSNDGGGNTFDMNSRVAKIESDVSHIQKDVDEMKYELKTLRVEFHHAVKSLQIGVQNKTDSHFKWLVAIFLTTYMSGFGGLALIMSHGFH